MSLYILSIVLHLIAVYKGIQSVRNAEVSARVYAWLLIVVALAFTVAQTLRIMEKPQIGSVADVAWIVFDWSNAMAHIAFAQSLLRKSKKKG